MAKKMETLVKENKSAKLVIESLLAKVQDTKIMTEEALRVVHNQPILKPFKYILERAKSREDLGKITEDLLGVLQAQKPEKTELPKPPVLRNKLEPLPSDHFRMEENRQARSYGTTDRQKVATHLIKKFGGK
jgi:hypothetical protein